MKRWKNIIGEYTCTLHDYGPEVYTDDDVRVACLDGRFETPYELTIRFKSSGYDDPGFAYHSNGDPGEPPEFEDERELDEAWVEVDGQRKDLPADVQQELFETFLTEIYAVDIDTDED